MYLPDRGQFISLHGDRAAPRPCIVRLWSGHSPRILRRPLQVLPAQVRRALLIRKHEDASCRACPGTGRQRPQAGILSLALLGRIDLALTVHLVFRFCNPVERGCASHSPRWNSLKEKSAPAATTRTAIASGLLDSIHVWSRPRIRTFSAVFCDPDPGFPHSCPQAGAMGACQDRPTTLSHGSDPRCSRSDPPCGASPAPPSPGPGVGGPGTGMNGGGGVMQATGFPQESASNLSTATS